MSPIAVKLITATISTFGFSILFFIHPRRLPVATLGGVLTCGVYLLAAHLLGGELIPNMLAALVGAGFSEVMARVTKAPVPVYMMPCIITLVPGSKLYATMFGIVTGDYAVASAEGMCTLEIALGIAGGIVIASVLGIIFRPRSRSRIKH